MEAIQDWTTHLFTSHQTLQPYIPWVRQAYLSICRLQSFILPLIDQVTRKPDLATIALLLVILFVSLKILDILWRTILFWLKLAKRVAFWGGLLALGLWMWSRGPEGVWEDMQYWVDVWGKEHEYWRERERVARMARQGRGGGNGWF